MADLPPYVRSVNICTKLLLRFVKAMNVCRNVPQTATSLWVIDLTAAQVQCAAVVGLAHIPPCVVCVVVRCSTRYRDARQLSGSVPRVRVRAVRQCIARSVICHGLGWIVTDRDGSQAVLLIIIPMPFCVPDIDVRFVTRLYREYSEYYRKRPASFKGDRLRKTSRLYSVPRLSPIWCPVLQVHYTPSTKFVLSASYGMMFMFSWRNIISVTEHVSVALNRA